MQRSTKIKYLALTEARRGLGLTNDQVATALGVKPAWWRGLLVGRCVASPDETDRIVALLGVPRDQIPHVHLPEHRFTDDAPRPAETTPTPEEQPETPVAA